MMGSCGDKGGEMTGSSGEREEISFCRICQAFCGIRVSVRNGRVDRVRGDPENPASEGFTCVKGRQLPAQINHADRLLRPLRRGRDGTHIPVPSGKALDEVADCLRDIIERYGPRAVSLYVGNGVLGHSAGNLVAQRFLRAIGSPMSFTSTTIDQPGKVVALSLHGAWGASMSALADSDVWLFLGTNPLVSLWAGTGIHNPAVRLREAQRNGTTLVVVDPRRTQTAQLADIHLQIRPGEDATLLAGMLRVLLTEGLSDDEFCRRHVRGLDGSAPRWSRSTRSW
jgi:anaerobic selenocysteine-containing dehydrogenase